MSTREISPSEARSRKTRYRETVKIILDSEWGEKLGKLQIRLAFLERQGRERPGDTSLLPEIEEVTTEIEAMMEDADQNILTVEFVGLSADRYERLMRAHPPTPEQRKQGARDGQAVNFNPDTLPPSLVAACWAKPSSWTEADIRELWDSGDEGREDDEDQPAGSKWNSGELADLFRGAQVACLARHRVE
jgi:hypothetical protein